MLPFDLLARDLLVPREPETPLDFAIDPLEDPGDPAAVGAHVVDNAIIGREHREELHRKDRGGGEESLDDPLVRDRALADPVEILQAAGERTLTIVRLANGLHDRPQLVSDLYRAQIVATRHSVGHTDDGRN